MGGVITRKSELAMRFFITALVLLISVSGCRTTSSEILTQLAASATVQIPSKVTSTLTPTVELTVTPSATQTREPTPTPPSSFSATINANYALLRSGPSSMHQPILRYPYETTVTITGKATGDEWVFVQVPDQNTGWLSVQYLDLEYPLSAVPVQAAADTDLIYGIIQDSTGSRLAGVGISVCIDLCYQSHRTDAVSNQNGEFFAYVPNTTGDQLRVFVSSVDCWSSIMGPDCQFKGTFMPEEIIIKEIPNIDPLLFMYYPPSQ